MNEFLPNRQCGTTSDAVPPVRFSFLKDRDRAGPRPLLPFIASRLIRMDGRQDSVVASIEETGST